MGPSNLGTQQPSNPYLGKLPPMRLTKERVAARLQGRFFLRIHMTLILGGTFLAGLAATNLLVLLGVDHLGLRYLFAVAGSYLVFLVLIRLWLFYVNADRRGFDFTADGIDIIDWHISPNDVDVGAGFGGGGATGGWEGSPDVPLPVAAKADANPGCGFDLDGDEGVIILLILALVCALLVIGIYLIYTAPVLLSEAAFEAILAASLARKTKKMATAGWVGSVWRATVWPLAITLVLSFALGAAAQSYCPEAKRLRDVWHCPARV